MGIYEHKPERFLAELCKHSEEEPPREVAHAYCAGYECGDWRAKQFAGHLIEWLPDYALIEDELREINHANSYIKLQQAAVRVYTSEKYTSRGEVGEIALHAICREFFGTIPISQRVYYKSASNDVVKGFDLVHARFINGDDIEIWLGESKLYKDDTDAVVSAIASVAEHLDKGFLTEQKLLLGPQIPRTTPNYNKLLKLFKSQTSLDDLLSSAVFVIGVLCTSDAASKASMADDAYKNAVNNELARLFEKVKKSGLCGKVKILFIYVPLADKTTLIDAFDNKLKGLQC